MTRSRFIDEPQNLDCIQGMSLLPASSIDLVFADLPYGRTMQGWDEPVPMGPFWEEVERVCKEAAPVVFTAVEPFASLLVCSKPKWFRYDMIWRKNKSTGFLNAKKRPLRAHENILVFWRKQPRYVPLMTDGHEPGYAVKERLSRTKLYGETPRPWSWRGSTMRYPTSVLEIPIVNGDSPERFHSNQKPEALPGWFIEAYTRAGDVVLDPTFGSGSTLLAARDRRRHFVGFEISKKMTNVAKKRLLERSLPGRTK